MTAVCQTIEYWQQYVRLFNVDSSMSDYLMCWQQYVRLFNFDSGMSDFQFSRELLRTLKINAKLQILQNIWASTVGLTNPVFLTTKSQHPHSLRILHPHDLGLPQNTLTGTCQPNPSSCVSQLCLFLFFKTLLKIQDDWPLAITSWPVTRYDQICVWRRFCTL